MAQAYLRPFQPSKKKKTGEKTGGGDESDDESDKEDESDVMVDLESDDESMPDLADVSDSDLDAPASADEDADAWDDLTAAEQVEMLAETKKAKTVVSQVCPDSFVHSAGVM